MAETMIKAAVELNAQFELRKNVIYYDVWFVLKENFETDKGIYFKCSVPINSSIRRTSSSLDVSKPGLSQKFPAYLFEANRA